MPTSPEPEPESAGAPTPATRRNPVARVRERTERSLVGLHALRRRNRMIDVGFRTWERDARVGGGVLAAALAFRIFLFLVPFVFVAVSLVPISAEAAGSTTREVTDRFGIAGLAGRALRGTASMSPTGRLWLLLGTIVALVLATRALLRVLSVVHGLAWHLPLDQIGKPRTVRDGTVTILGTTGIVLLGALAAGLRDNLGVLGILPVALDWTVVGVLWFLVLLYLPHAGARWRDLVPGAVLFAVGTWALQILTVVWYVRVLDQRSTAFGAIGVALTLMAWSYLLGRIVVTGANLNVVLVEHRPAETGTDTTPG